VGIWQSLIFDALAVVLVFSNRQAPIGTTIASTQDVSVYQFLEVN
jgi:hypothetical protein